MKALLILFAGGDGTARDIYRAINRKTPVLGIPTGVKLHSACFGINPRKTGELTYKYLTEDLPLREAEVMDIDEDTYRQGRVSTKLYGYLLVPFERQLLQSSKTSMYDLENEEDQKQAIATYIVEEMDKDTYYILGPGSTVQSIGKKLKIDKTLLGVDIIKNGQLILKDVNEEHLLETIKDKKSKIIVTPIGGQGHIFGRGNQQISPRVIRKIGKNNIVIIATKNKLQSLMNKSLLLDTGDLKLDESLSGYTRVIVDYREELIKKIEF